MAPRRIDSSMNPDDRTIRRILAAHAATVGSIYPNSSREFKAWLRDPSTAVSAVWILPKVAIRNRPCR
jgi:hypothetical protein